MDVFQPKKTLQCSICVFSVNSNNNEITGRKHTIRCISCCFLCICMYFLPISSRWWAPATRAYARINPSTPVDGIYQGWGVTSFRETSWNENEFLIFQYFTNLENLEHKAKCQSNPNFSYFLQGDLWEFSWPESRYLSILLPFLQLVQWMVQLIAILGISSHIIPPKKKAHCQNHICPERFCTAAHCRIPRYPYKPPKIWVGWGSQSDNVCDVTWGGGTIRNLQKNRKKKQNIF